MSSSSIMLRRTEESAAFISERTGIRPKAGIVLGTGLSTFVSGTGMSESIAYSDIPHFPVSSVEGHRGRLFFGNIGPTAVVIMQGRIHYYEGYSMQEVIFPVQVMKQLGVDYLLLSNAAGGINPEFSVGDLMVLEDHISMLPDPLAGPHEKKFGPRFPDMSEPYDRGMIGEAFRIAEKENISLRKGCYVGVTGPSYETPAEYRLFRMIGGDAVGMSTVPEVIAARQMGMKCFATSVITDLGVPGKIEFLTHEMVQRAAMAAEPKMAVIFRALAGALG